MIIHTPEIDLLTALPLIPVVTLRRWLRGSWALLFSHPDDFACEDFEMDRWLTQVREAFAMAWVRPLALATEAGTNGGAWIAGAGGGGAAKFDQPLQDYPLSRNAPERTLQQIVMTADSRFVMMLDNSLRLHRTLIYGAADLLPSPMELAASVAHCAKAWCKLLPSQSSGGVAHEQGSGQEEGS
jgi:hypothetical protein